MCCNIYTHPKRKPKHFIYKNHIIRIDTDMRMRREGYKLTQRIIIDPSQKNYKKILNKQAVCGPPIFLFKNFERPDHICGRGEFEILCSLHNFGSKTLCNLSTNFFLKVLDFWLTMCYTNNVERGGKPPWGSPRESLTETAGTVFVLWEPDKQCRNPLAGERSRTQGSCESGGNRETPHH